MRRAKLGLGIDEYTPPQIMLHKTMFNAKGSKLDEDKSPQPTRPKDVMKGRDVFMAQLSGHYSFDIIHLQFLRTMKL